MSTGQASRYAEMSLGGADPNVAISASRLGLRVGTTLFDKTATDGTGQWLLTEDNVWRPSGGGGESAFPLTSAVSAGGFQIHDLGDGDAATDAANLKNINDAIAAMLAALVVETAQIANLAVTTGKIADLAVTAAKLAAGAVVAVGAVGATTAYTGATNVAGSSELLIASAVLGAAVTHHDISVSAIGQIFSLPAAAAIGDIHVLDDVGNNWAMFNITVDVEGGGTIANGVAGDVASLALVDSGQTRTFKKIGATAWKLSQ